MAVKDGKYFSLGDANIYSEKTLSNASGNSLSCLEDELYLGNEMLKYGILTEEKYEKSPLAKKTTTRNTLLLTTKAMFLSMRQ